MAVKRHRLLDVIQKASDTGIRQCTCLDSAQKVGEDQGVLMRINLQLRLIAITLAGVSIAREHFAGGG
jgi:hypothetical protein